MTNIFQQAKEEARRKAAGSIPKEFESLFGNIFGDRKPTDQEVEAFKLYLTAVMGGLKKR